MERLRNHQRLRIVYVGDPVLVEMTRVPVDMFLQRLYPGCLVEIMPTRCSLTASGSVDSGCIERVLKVRPDLIIAGGVSDSEGLVALQRLVEKVRSNNALGLHRTEILLVTKGWNAGGESAANLRFTSDMRELDQALENNEAIPEDIRGQLLRFAAVNEVEFLDMMGIVSEFVFGPAADSGVGRRSGPDGVPYAFWGRDWLPGDDSGRHIIGRILEAYFAPSDRDMRVTPGSGEVSDAKPVRMFDPEERAEDRAAYLAVRGEFGASAVEKPALAVRGGTEKSRADGATETGKVTFRVSGQAIWETGYVFDEPLDVRSGDVMVYWSFRSDQSAGEDAGKLTMHLAFTDPTAGGREDRSQVSVTVRPGAASILGVGGGMKASSEVEHWVEAPVENFIDRSKAAKFRLWLRWVGGERMVAEVASWNPRSSRWEGFIPFDRPGAPTFAMELSSSRDLLGTSSFKSIHFETQSNVPVLESVLVTVRPSMIR